MMTYNELLLETMNVRLGMTEREAAKHDLIKKYWPKVSARLRYEYLAIRENGEKRSKKLMVELITAPSPLFEALKKLPAPEPTLFALKRLE